jgi:atypical dual specificity phosphatase
MHPRIAQLIFLPTYAWNLLLGRILKFRHWWDEVEPGVLLGARPLQCDVQPLFDAGVRGVVNMCDEYRGPIKEYERLGVEQQWLRTIDFQPPSLQHIHDGVEFIQRTLDANKKVYVHCKAGRGRSATIVLCWLVKYRKMTAKQAQAALLAKRPHVKSDLDQREVVKEYEQAILASRKNTDGS